LVSDLGFSTFLVFFVALLALETAPDEPCRVGKGVADFAGLGAGAGVAEDAAAAARDLALADGLAGAEDGIFPLVPAALPGFAAGTGGAN
jgi:hypothetical protein